MSGKQFIANRIRNGCDVDCERALYAITCPRCNGAAHSGLECDVCGTGPTPGFLHMRRCPASYLSGDVAQAIHALRWLREGVLPIGGSLAEQSISFVEFVSVFDAERHSIENEQRKAAEARARASRNKK